MSFDINPPSKNLSNVQASAKACPGGGGNTGYFRRDNEQEDEINLHFSRELEQDSFELSEDEEENTGILEYIKKIILDMVKAIKKFFVK